jgi:hypothetical protein
VDSDGPLFSRAAEHLNRRLIVEVDRDVDDFTPFAKGEGRRVSPYAGQIEADGRTRPYDLVKLHGTQRNDVGAGKRPLKIPLGHRKPPVAAHPNPDLRSGSASLRNWAFPSLGSGRVLRGFRPRFARTAPRPFAR